MVLFTRYCMQGKDTKQQTSMLLFKDMLCSLHMHLLDYICLVPLFNETVYNPSIFKMCDHMQPEVPLSHHDRRSPN